MNYTLEVEAKRNNALYLSLLIFLCFPFIIQAQLSSSSIIQHNPYTPLRTSEVKVADVEINEQHLYPIVHDKNGKPSIYPLNALSQYTLPSKVVSTSAPASIVEFPYSAYSYHDLGFFCKWEVHMEKAARIPVKFRLGEVQYVERMEGKLPYLPQ